VLAGKSSYFAAIAANGHGTPAAAACARIVVEEQTTVWIGAKPKACASSLGDNFRSGSGHRGEQPIKTSLPRNEFDLPEAVQRDEFIVPLCNTQYFVYRLDPFHGYSLLSEHGCEHLVQGGAEPPGFQEQRFRSPRIGLRQTQKLGAALSGDNSRRLQKANEVCPG
jgi:hypothetical protein